MVDECMLCTSALASTCIYTLASCLLIAMSEWVQENSLVQFNQSLTVSSALSLFLSDSFSAIEVIFVVILFFPAFSLAFIPGIYSIFIQTNVHQRSYIFTVASVFNLDEIAKHRLLICLHISEIRREHDDIWHFMTFVSCLNSQINEATIMFRCR